MKTNQITENLSWVALRYQFGTVADLDAAIKNGKILEMLTKSSEELQDGDLQAAVGHFRRNLSSVASNIKKAKTLRTEQMHDRERYDLLWAYTSTLMEKKPGASKTKIAAIGNKARWQLTMEEMKALPDEYKVIDSVYQNLQSKMSKAPEALLKEMSMVEYQERFAYISRRRSALKAKAKRNERIQRGKELNDIIDTRLTPEEKEKLLVLLGLKK